MKGKEPAFRYDSSYYGWWETKQAGEYMVTIKSLFFDKDTKLITK